MGHSNFKLFLLLATLLFFHQHPLTFAVPSDQPSVLTPSGLKVPLHIVRSALHPKAGPNADAEAHLFDVSSSGHLRGPEGFSLQLHDLPARSVDPHSTARFILNGKSAAQSARGLTTMRSGSGVHAVYAGQHKQLITVWGPSLNLRPLHSVDHPTVFVNDAPYISHITADVDVSGETTSGPIPSFQTDDGGIDVPKDPHVANGPPAAAISATCASGSIHYVELAMVSDNSFCAMLQNNPTFVLATMQSLVDLTNTLSFQTSCVRLAISYFEISCEDPSDPYESLHIPLGAHPYNTISKAILYRFKDYWNSNRGGVSRDTAHILTGFRADPNAIGIAFRPGMCNSYAYGWTEQINWETFAHEIGHNLNCTHTSTGLMQSGGTDVFLPSDTLSTMTSFVDSSATSCVTTTAPVCDSDCPHACVDNKCVAPTVPGPGLIACSYSEAVRYCAEVSTGGGFSWHSRVECPTTHPFVQVAFDASDANVLCCTPPTSTLSTLTADRFDTYVFTGFFTDTTIAVTQGIFPYGFVGDENLIAADHVSSCTLDDPPPQPHTCGDTFTIAIHLQCSKVLSKRVRVRGVGPARIVAKMEYGTVNVQVTGKRGRKIGGIGVVVNTSAASTAEMAMVYSDLELQSKREVRVSSAVTEMVLASGSTTCCGAGALTATIKMNLCWGSRCRTKEFTLPLTVSCGEVCDEDPAVAGALPMGPGDQCPQCELVG